MSVHILTYVVLFSFKFSSCAQIYSAVSDLELMLKIEEELNDRINDYVQKEYQRLQSLEKMAAEKFNGDVLNPVDAFKLIKRLSSDLNYVRHEYISDHNTEDLNDWLREMEGKLPDDEDLRGASEALFRLMDTYSIDPLSYSTGSDAIPMLSFYELHELGLIAFESKDYYHNYLLFNATLARFDEADDNGFKKFEVSKVKTLGFMVYSLYQLGNLFKAYVLTLELLKINGTVETAWRNKERLEEELKEMDVDTNRRESVRRVERPLRGFKKEGGFSEYEKLCRGETIPNTENLKLGHCYYSRHHPIFYLKPLKSELLSKSLAISIHHDVIRNKRANHIIHLANPKLTRATVQDSLTGDPLVTDYRVGKNAWLTDDDIVIQRSSLLTAAFTNLTLSTAEEWQVLNYGIGGHYEPHYDFSTEEESDTSPSGNRILTTLCYLSDVRKGGATVFPKIGVMIVPEKGSCATWFNLHEDGQGDLVTWHAACPVLDGNKWVANKWFHERGQEFVRGCPIKRHFSR